MTLAGVAKTLERAFATRNAKAVALVINSPGGSPVQSRQIYLRIRQLAAEKKLPVLVFVEDVAASGGYMIACAGDEIFCDPSSILGSIGVVGGSFGFQELIKKIGVERRLYTAGEHKAMLDPFLPENPDDVARLKAIQREIHAHLHRAGEGEPRRAAEGRRRCAVHRRILGRRDARSRSAWPTRSAICARRCAPASARRCCTPVIAPASGMLSGLLGRKSPGAGRAGSLDGIAGLPDELISALETRAIWAKFGF